MIWGVFIGFGGYAVGLHYRVWCDGVKGKALGLGMRLFVMGGLIHMC